MSWPARVAIVGAGTMGVGISHVFASNGIPTVLVDSTPELAEAARERSLDLLARLEAAGKLGEGAATAARENITAAASVGEGVERRRPDRRGRRRAPRREGGGLRGDRGGSRRRRGDRDEHVVDPDRGARGGAATAGRFLGMHWFVPPLLVPCVEVIPRRVRRTTGSCSRSSAR